MRIECRVKILVVAYALLAILIVAVSIAATLPKDQAADGAISVKATPRFTVKDYNGRVAVFASGSSDPFKIYDVYTSTLPLSDQTALLEGIELYDITSLRQLIEDYTS